MVGGAIGSFADKAAFDDIQGWFAAHPAGSAERKVKQSLESIRGRVWRAHILKAEEAAVTAAIRKLLPSA